VYALLLDPFQPLIAPEVTSFFSFGSGGSSSSSWISELCLGPMDYNGRSWLKLFVPIIAFVLHALTFILRELWRSYRGNPLEPKVALYYQRTAVELLMTAHSGWLQLGLQSANFACIDTGAHGSWLAASPDTPCTIDGSRAFFIIISVLMCGWPIAVWWFLKRNKDRLDREDFQIVYGPLFQNFRKSRWWWAIVIICRRSLLVIFYTMLFRYDTARYLALTFCNIIIFIIHLLAQPYIQVYDNSLEFFFLFSLSLLASPTLFYQVIVLVVTIAAFGGWALWKIRKKCCPSGTATDESSGAPSWLTSLCPFLRDQQLETTTDNR
jgi:hypothetical protein